MITARSSLVASLSVPVLLALVSCASAPAATADARTGHGHGAGGMSGDMDKSCPMMVSGTTVSSEDVDSGAALVFTTTGDVAALLDHVTAMAAKHTAMHADGMHGAMKVPASDARMEVVDGGARLILTVKEPADVEALRTHVRTRASSMQAGKCPMMEKETGT